MTTTTPLRWLLMAGHVPPDLQGGGIVRYTVELARALAARDDVTLSLLGGRESAGPLAELAGPRGSFVELPALPGALVSPFERWGLGRRLGDRFDVVHGVKHLIPARARAHTLLTVHDMLVFDRPSDYPPAKRWLLRKPYEASLRDADSLVCVSGASRARLEALLPGQRDKASVVLSATGSALLDAVPAPVPELAGTTFALVVGDPSVRKNLATVTSAWRAVVDAHPGAVLVLVGPPPWGVTSYGPDFEALEAAGSVRRLVGVDDGTLRWLYENAAVVLAPSLAEGFGLPAVEALDLGAQLVTSDDPALVEVSGDLAEHVPALDVAAWSAATIRHLDSAVDAVPAPRTVRTWADVAQETVDAVLRALRP